MKDLTTSYPQPDHDGQFIIQQSTIEVKNDPEEDPPQSLWHKNLEVHHLILKVQFLFFRVWSQRGKDGCRSCERESSLGLSEEAHGAQGGCWLDNDFLIFLKWILQRLMHDWRIWGTNWRIWQQPMQSPRMISRWYYEISINTTKTIYYVIPGSAKCGSDCWWGAQAAHWGEVHCQGGSSLSWLK